MKRILPLFFILFACSFNSYGDTTTVNDASKLNAALGNAKSGDIIVLGDDITFSTGFYATCNNENSFTLNLNGHTISGSYGVNQNIDGVLSCTKGSITIIDSSSEKTGSIVNNATSGGSAIYFSSTGTLTIKGGTFKGATALHICNGSTVNIEGGYIKGYTSDISINTTLSKLQISGGYFSKSKSSTFFPNKNYYCYDNPDNKTNTEFPYMVSNDVLIAYEGSSTTTATTAITASNWTNIQESYPNAIAVVPNIFASWASDKTNVLVKSADGNSYTCEKLVLTDLKDFYTPYDFTATQATYTRATTVSYNSLCLPFAITPEDVNGTIYTFGSLNSTDNTVTMTEQNGVNAGVPCIFKSNSVGSDLTITKNNIDVSQSINNNGVIKGAYTLTTGFGGTGVYKLNSTGTALGITTTSAKCYPFRSYIDLTDNNAKESTIGIIWGEDISTNIETVNSSNETFLPKELFSVDGLRIQQVQPGLNVVKKASGKFIKVVTK